MFANRSRSGAAGSIGRGLNLNSVGTVQKPSNRSLESIAFKGAWNDFPETYNVSISGESKQTITIIPLAERPGGAARRSAAPG